MITLFDRCYITNCGEIKHPSSPYLDKIDIEMSFRVTIRFFNKWFDTQMHVVKFN